MARKRRKIKRRTRKKKTIQKPAVQKPIFSSIAICSILIIMWSILLFSMDFLILIPLIYVLTTIILLKRVFHRNEKQIYSRTIAQYLKISFLFAVVLAIIDLALSIVLSGEISTVSTMTMGASTKIIFCLVGASLFYVTTNWMNSKNKFLLSNTGTIYRRIMAAFFDISLVIIAFFTVDALLIAANNFTQIGSTVIVFTMIAVTIGYKLIYEISTGKTPGKELFGIRIKAPPSKIIIRNLNLVVLAAMLLPTILGPNLWIAYLIFGLDALMFFTGKRIFDLLAGTTVKRI